jgi:hypothetical protein
MSSRLQDPAKAIFPGDYEKLPSCGGILLPILSFLWLAIGRRKNLFLKLNGKREGVKRFKSREE